MTVDFFVVLLCVRAALIGGYVLLVGVPRRPPVVNTPLPFLIGVLRDVLEGVGLY